MSAPLSRRLRAPIIESVGAPPARHAERVVDEMLAWMHQARGPMELRCRGLLDPRKMSTPEKQMEAGKRLAETVGWLGLDCTVAPAKRGRYLINLTSWTIWCAERDRIVMRDEALPERAWLAVVTAAYTGRNYVSRVAWWPFLLVSRHACVRLAERAGVRTVGGLVRALRDIWDEVRDLIGEDPNDEKWINPPDGCWRVPAPGGCWAVLEPHAVSKDKLVLKTILSPEML